MKVIPHIKQKSLALNEARIINVDNASVEELLLENLTEHAKDYFGIDDVKDNSICIMNWDQKGGFLTYAVMPIKYCIDGYDLNIDYIRKKIGITTNSLFRHHPYQSITLTKEHLLEKRKKAGDSFA